MRTAARIPHAVLLRANDVGADTRAKKMAVSLGRLGFRVTVVCTTDGGDPRVSRLPGATIERIPVKPAYSDSLGVLRREHRAWRPKFVPSRYEETYLGFKNRLHLNRVEAMRGRALRVPPRPDVTERVRLVMERLTIATWRRFNDLRIEYVPKAQEAIEDWWKRRDERRRDNPAGNWRTDWVRVRELEARLADHILALEPDVIQAHDLTVLQIAVDAADRARARGRKVAVVYDAIENWAGLPPEDCGTPRMHNAFLSLEREYAPLADGVITVSDDIAKILWDRYSLAERPTVALNVPVYRPLERPSYTVREAAGLAEDVMLMVYAGIVTRARGIDFLIDAMASIPHVHLAIVAVPWPSPVAEEIRMRCTPAGVGDRVHLVPPVDPEHIIPFLSGANIGVHPLSTEAVNHNVTLGNKMFDYVHAGLRLVVSDARGMARFVERHRLGEVFRFGDVGDFARAVRRVLHAPAGTYLEGEDLDRWRVEYSWQEQEAGLSKLFSQMLGMDLRVNDKPFPSLEELPGD